MSKELNEIKTQVDDLENALYALSLDASRIMEALSELNPEAETIVCRCAICRMDMDTKKEPNGARGFKITIQPCGCQDVKTT